MSVHPDPATAHTAGHAPGPTLHEFTADGPIDLNIQNLRGDVTVRAEHTTSIQVTLTPRGKAAEELVERMTVRFAHGRLTVDPPAGEAGYISTGFGDFFRAFGAGEGRTSWADRLADGVRSLVRGAEGLAGELAIEVVVPAGSRAVVSTGIGDVRVLGSLARLEVKSGTGDMHIGRGAEESTRLTTGTGDIEVDGPATGTLRTHTGTGDITLQQTDGEVEVFAGVGDITVTRARSGVLSTRTGLGDIEVRIAPGTATRLDLATGFGERDVRLTPADGAAGAERTLEVEAKSSKGDLRILRA